MLSHEAIGWIVQNNSVEDRIIDNSLIHKFTPSAKIRRRTKILNTKIKKYSGVKDYKHYVELKTDVIRNLVEDTDTDNSDNLSDTDYDIIYSSLRQTESSVANSERYIFTEDDCKGFKKKTNTKRKDRNNINNIKASIPKKKPLQAKYNTRASQKRIDWQKVTKKNKISHLSNNQTCTNSEENIVKNNSDYLLAQSNNQSRSLPFDSQNSTTSNIVKSVNGNIRESCIDSNIVINESNSQDTIFNEIKPSESEIQDYKEQNAVIDKSNTKLDSQNPPDSLPKNLISSSKSIILENIEGSDNEISTVNKLKNNNNNKLVEVNNKNLINSKNYSNTYESHKSKLLKNVRRNLTPVLEEADLMNNDKDIEKDKNEENGLNYNQLLVPTTNCTRHSTPIKKIRSNLSPDQQKDSGFEDSQDRFIKIEQNNIKSSTILDTAKKMLIFPQQFEKIAEIEITTLENSKEATNNDNILEKQDKKAFSEEEEEEEKNSSQLNSIDKNIKQKVCFTNQENKTKFVQAEENIEKQQSLSPKENHAKDAHSKSCDNILKEQENINEEETSEGKVKHSLRLNEADKDAEIYSINCQDNTHSMKLEDSCNIEKQQMLPKITYTEIINQQYMIINKQDDNINIEKNDINSQEELLSKAEKINNNLIFSLETDSEEDNANYISPETKKRLQQQSRLNLVVSSDSSPSDDEYITVETSKKHDDDSDTSCSKDMFENDKTNCEKTNIDISCSKDSSNEVVPVPIEEKIKVDSSNIKKEIKTQANKTISLTSCTYKNNNSSTSDVNKNLLKEIQYCANVYNDEDNHNESIEESFQLRVSENNISSLSEESRNQFSRNKSSLNKENFCDESIQDEDRISDCISEFGTRCKSKHEQNTHVSTKHSNAHLDISCHSRPYNLQQLIEDENLLVETIPAGFTLADLTEDDEAFILNIPNKVLQCNLQSQLLSLKENTIKFGKNKYRIVRRKVGTVSCIFATGKKRRPYKTVNIKNISTITVRERLPHCSRKSDVSNSYDAVISSESESSKINNQQTNGTKMLKVDRNKRKRRSSDFETEQSTTKKGRLKLIHS